MAEPAFDALWNYQDPAGTEAKFRALLPTLESAEDLNILLELETQIARTQGLQKRFDEAFATLNAVAARLRPETKRATIRYELEMERGLRSSGKPEEAKAHFDRAGQTAQQAGEDALCIDAIHMLALVEPDIEKQIWHNMYALRIAEASAEPRARNWRASLWNNIGMSYHDLGKFDDALAAFEAALPLREDTGDAYTIQVAKWMIAWTLRLQGRLAEAHAMQRALEAANPEDPDGYVLEELAELNLALSNMAEAKTYFARAADKLEGELGGTERLARMRKLAAS